MRRFTLFGGPNGAGKSTLYRINAFPMEHLGERINVDEIASVLGDWRDDAVQTQAARLAVEKSRSCIRDGMTFHQESTLAGRSIFQLVRNAKAAGYLTELHYVCVEDPSAAIQRVHHRIRMGGHGVEDDVIVRRYHESIRNVREYLSLFDYAVFYDNMSEIRIVAKVRKGRIVWMQGDISWFDKIIQ